jgi:thymidylate synthase (FAD)
MMNPLKRVENVLGDGDKSWVELQDMMPHPNHRARSDSPAYDADSAVVQAARVSMLGESKGEEADKKLLFYLLKHRHTTPFEQVEFKFRIKAPVVVWWQWVRHRTWHYNFQSGRYTEFAEDDFYIPAEWRLQSKDNKQGSDGVVEPAVNRLLSMRMEQTARDGFSNYQLALDEEVAKEQARFFLPAWSSYYVAVCKVDAWNLMNFIRLRSDPHAQWEIRQYSDALYSMLKEYMPWTAEAMIETNMIQAE